MALKYCARSDTEENCANTKNDCARFYRVAALTFCIRCIAILISQCLQKILTALFVRSLLSSCPSLQTEPNTKRNANNVFDDVIVEKSV